MIEKAEQFCSEAPNLIRDEAAEYFSMVTRDGD
jgi:hypothetical protein